MEKIDQVLGLITSLKEEELKNIRTRIDFLLSSKKGTEKKSTEEIQFYTLLTNEIERRLKKKPSPFPVFKKQAIYKKFKKTFEEMLEYRKDCTGGILLDKKMRGSFNSLAIGVVLGDFDDSPIPLSMTTALTTFANLPGLLDRSFPGYVRGGAMLILLKSKRRKEK